MIKWNLGCSDQQIEGFIGVDLWTPPWATPDNFVKADLRHSWPAKDGEVDYIRAYDIIEHMPDKIHTLNEIHRVLKPGGIVEIVVPTTDGGGAWQDPTHVSYWNRNSFLYHTFGDPHYNRFHEAYGVKGAFRVKSERLEKFADGVVKLHITLEAVKSAVNEKRPAFSILHTSARPGEWFKVYREWIAQAADPSCIEYILCVDQRWGFDLADYDLFKCNTRPQDKLVWNTGRKCYVDGVNIAAGVATGDTLVVNADDQYPCDKWDEKIKFQRDHSAAFHAACPSELKGDWVLSVSTGTPKEHEREIMVMPILSRERYEKYGYVFYPQYESMFADNDFYALAKRDSVIVDTRGLIFPHKHWLNKQREMDEADKAQNRPEAYQLGEAIFNARKASNFADVKVEYAEEKPTRKTVAVFAPGNNFSRTWVDAWTTLSLHIAGNYVFNRMMGYTTGVGIIRNFFTQEIMKCPHPIDFVLWLDDDNTLTPEQFEMLMADLNEHPEYDAIAAWCWCGNDDDAEAGTATMSCGALKDVEATEDGKDVKFCHTASLTIKQMQESRTDLIEIGYSGFPAVLMRFDLLRKAGKTPFNPFIDDRCEHGMSGEDVAFFARTTIRSGARYAVDRRVYIPHYKRRPIEPAGVRVEREAAAILR